jgi:thiamine kinase-like enzyme
LKTTTRNLLKNIPQLSNIAFSNIKLQELAGLTNENYLVTVTTTTKQKYVLRIPRESTNGFINRDNESHNVQIAEQLNIAPKKLWREVSGTSLTEYLENTTKPKTDDSKSLEKIAKTLATLHSSKIVFKGKLNNQEIAKHLTQYFEICSNEQQELLKADHQKALLLLDTQLCNRPAVPSHIDLVLENILQQGEKVWFIDWEYSAMASPFWDIATFCNSAQFDSAESVAFLKMTLVDYQQSDFECLEQYRFITKAVSDCWQVAFKESI